MNEEITRIADKLAAAVDRSDKRTRRTYRWGQATILLVAITILNGLSALGSRWSGSTVAAAVFVLIGGTSTTAAVWTYCMAHCSAADSDVERCRIAGYGLAARFEQLVNEVDRGKVHDDEEVMAL